MLEPITDWERDLWPVFDRLKSAMDRQEEARVAGTLDEFVRSATPLFSFIVRLTSLAWGFDRLQTEWVYLNWKRSRGIDQWVPDRDLPLRWMLAEQAMVPLPPAEAMEKITTVPPPTVRRLAKQLYDAAEIARDSKIEIDGRVLPLRPAAYNYYRGAQGHKLGFQTNQPRTIGVTLRKTF